MPRGRARRRTRAFRAQRAAHPGMGRRRRSSRQADERRMAPVPREEAAGPEHDDGAGHRQPNDEVPGRRRVAERVGKVVPQQVLELVHRGDEEGGHERRRDADERPVEHQAQPRRDPAPVPGTPSVRVARPGPPPPPDWVRPPIVAKCKRLARGGSVARSGRGGRTASEQGAHDDPRPIPGHRPGGDRDRRGPRHRRRVRRGAGRGGRRRRDLGPDRVAARRASPRRSRRPGGAPPSSPPT